jgi:CheY-like chemotaxis protein
MMNTKPQTLLIVDDEIDFREVLSLSFERKGFKTLMAGSGNEAMEMIKKNEAIDLIISDVQMPNGDGKELLKRVREYHFCKPIFLFLSGFSKVSAIEAYDGGAEGILTKPIDFSSILSVVIKALQPLQTRWQPSEWRGEANLTIKLKFESFDAIQSGRVLNIGRGGFYIASNETLPKVNDKVFFKIDFTRDVIPLIEGHGIVKWVRPSQEGLNAPGFGVEITDLNDETRNQLITLIHTMKMFRYIPKS